MLPLPQPKHCVAAVRLPLAQGEEPWQATDMRLAVETFRGCFLDALQQEVKEGLAERSREAAAAPTLAW
jgi:hypothetical protein